MKLHPKISGFSFLVHFQEGIVWIMRIVFRAPFPIQFAGLGSFAIVGPRHVQREWVSENSDTLFYEVRANGKLLDIAPAKKAPLSAVQVVFKWEGLAASCSRICIFVVYSSPSTSSPARAC